MLCLTPKPNKISLSNAKKPPKNKKSFVGKMGKWRIEQKTKRRVFNRSTIKKGSATSIRKHFNELKENCEVSN